VKKLVCFLNINWKKSKKGTEAKEYLLKRGLKEDTIKSWRIGYAPDTWQGLTDFLISRGFKEKILLKQD
jgi:DNA primase